MRDGEKQELRLTCDQTSCCWRAQAARQLNQDGIMVSPELVIIIYREMLALGR